MMLFSKLHKITLATRLIQFAGLCVVVALFTSTSVQSAWASTPTPSSSATHFDVSCSINSAQPGALFQISVTAVDNNNKTVIGYNGKLNFTSGLICNLDQNSSFSGSLCNLPESAQLTDGFGTFSASLGYIPCGVIAITATDVADTSITGTSAPIFVQQTTTYGEIPNTGSYVFMFAVTAPSSTVVGQPIECSVMALEKQNIVKNNVATDYYGTVHFSSSDSQAILPKSVSLVNGVGTFSVTLNTPGDQTFTVADAQDNNIDGSSNEIVVSNPPVASSDASLNSLTISSGTLTPSLSPDTAAYTDSIPSSVNSITITPTTDDSNATVTVNGASVTSGQVSGAIILKGGTNTIPVIVTAQDGTTTKTYTVTVTAAATNTPPAGTTASSVLVFTIGSTSYSVDGQTQSMDTAPIISKGRTLLPISYVAKPLGATVSWNQAQQMATVSLGSKTIQLVIGQDTASINGVTAPIDPSNSSVTPVLTSGRTMLPLAFIAENLGCSVDWNGDTQEVTVTYPASSN